MHLAGKATNLWQRIKDQQSIWNSAGALDSEVLADQYGRLDYNVIETTLDHDLLWLYHTVGNYKFDRLITESSNQSIKNYV